MQESPARLARQLSFLVEVDKLKQVVRRTSLIGGLRHENSAEHSWHLAVMAVVLAEYAGAVIDLRHVLRMLLVHDIVEVDAGDTFAFDLQGNATKAEREQMAATRIFGLLPEEQSEALRAVWDEFEEGVTPEAKFANALDRFAALLSNHHNDGGTWRQYGVSREAVLRRMDPIREGAPGLWPLVLQVVDAASATGALIP